MANKTLRFYDFFNNELRDYAIYDNVRNIPHIADGFKTTQRKVVFACQDVRKLKRVDMLGMKAAEMTSYNHSADSILSAVVTLAKDFPGANNVPLLDRDGQFGTSMDNKASSERYIKTQLSRNWNTLFNKEDQEILEWNYQEGERIEPMYYMPRLPVLLINGSQGVGNGFSCRILPHRVQDVKQAVEEVLATGLVQTPLKPHLEGWKGTVTMDAANQVQFEGKYEIVNKTTLKITELPPKHQLKGYKGLLLDLLQRKVITSYKNKSNQKEGWHIVITAPKEFISKPASEIKDVFDLVERTTQVITCWDVDGKLKVYKKAEQVVERWVEVRLAHYEKRRLNMVQKAAEEVHYSNVKRQFILWWNDNAQSLIKLSQGSLVHAVRTAIQAATDDDIKRLLALRISSLTLDEVERLTQECLQLRNELTRLQSINNRDLMVEELKSL